MSPAILSAVFLPHRYIRHGIPAFTRPDYRQIIDTMTSSHTNKTVSTLLASLFGGIGMHRFYMYGRKDWFGWLHLATLPLSALAVFLFSNTQPLFAGMLFILSILCGFVEALVIGLTPDEKWDTGHNPASGKTSESHWILAVILIATLGVGAMSVIALLARSFDLLFTGGAFG